VNETETKQSFLNRAKTIKRRYEAHQAPRVAAALSYYALMSGIPLLLVSMAILGWVVGGSDHAFNLVQRSLRGSLPVDGSFLYETLKQVAGSSGVFGWIGFGGLMLSSSVLMAEIEGALNLIMGANKPRVWWASKLSSVGLGLGIFALALGSVVATSVLAIVRAQTSTLIPEGVVTPYLWAILAMVPAWALSISMFTLIYRFAPNKDIIWREALNGGLLAGSVWEVAKLGAAEYFTRFGNYEKVYGSLGALIALMTWIYATMVCLLIGSEVAAWRTNNQLEKTIYAVDSLAPNEGVSESTAMETAAKPAAKQLPPTRGKATQPIAWAIVTFLTLKALRSPKRKL
jgi:membrane protein